MFRDITDAKLTKNEMAITIEAHKKHLIKKGVIFNCLVFDSMGWEQPTEFIDFLTTLENNKKNYPDNTRIQYVFLNKDHWTTADVLVANNKVSFFLIGVSNISTGLVKQIDLIQRNSSEDTAIMVSSLDIQKDGKSCAYLVLRLAKTLSEIPDLHQELMKAKNPVCHHMTRISEFLLLNNEEHLKSVKYISRDLLLQLDGFGSLFKNSQVSLNTKNVTCGKDKLLDLTFKRYQIEHKKDDDSTSMRNTRIDVKRNKMIENTQAFVSSISEAECLEIINNQDGKKFLSDLKNKKMRQKIKTVEEKSTVVTASSKNSIRMRFYQKTLFGPKVEPSVQPDKPAYTIVRSYFK